MISVLVVDDEFGVADVLAAMLGDAGYRVTVANNGADALSSFRESTIDLVLLDLMMPGMDGLQTLAALRAEPAAARVPVILMSEVHPRPLASNDQTSYDGYLVKPFAIGELITEIERLTRPKT